MNENEEDLARVVDYLIAGYGRAGAIRMARRRLEYFQDPSAPQIAHWWRQLLEKIEQSEEKAA